MSVKISDLFHKCAYDIAYVTYTDGTHDVNYSFVVHGKTLYIYFQGSNSKEDWIDNFRFWPRVKHFFKTLFVKKKKAYSNSEIKYHTGFLDCYELIRPIIIDKILEKNNSGELKFNHIVIVGYSHGAALAGLCYETVQYFRKDLLKGATLQGHCFEAPRWLYGSEKYINRWDGCYVYRNHTDIVTHVPPKFIGYKDACKIIKIGKNKHYGPIRSHYPDKVYESLCEWEERS